jgi:hypothetical protein
VVLEIEDVGWAAMWAVRYEEELLVGESLIVPDVNLREALQKQ